MTKPLATNQDNAGSILAPRSTIVPIESTDIPEGEVYMVSPENIKKYVWNEDQQLEEPGKKFDADKLRTDLVPIKAIKAMAKVLTYGANKYGDRNWEKGISWSRLYGAAQRHLLAWWEREAFDRESGLPHLHHALTCLAMLAHYRAYNRNLDDRPDFSNGLSSEQAAQEPHQ